MKRQNSMATRNHTIRFIPRLEALEARLVLTLDPMSQPRFVNPLPVPAVMEPTEPGGTHYEVSITQVEQDLGLFDPVTGKPLLTTVWGYNGSYPGATFEARRDTPITVRWNNDLVDGKGSVLPHLFPVDPSRHWAAPKGWPDSGVPVVTHLHGGHTEAASDGHPEAWFTPGFSQGGPQWVQDTYTYANDQEAATLWYHDHTLGITSLNVYAGLAGFYNLRDDWEDSLNLPKGEFEIPLAIQDRMFSDEGQLVYPEMAMMTGGSFGDFILVNGKAWPFLEVEPRKYRFRLLNGSDSRFYDLRLLIDDADEHSFFQIGTDEGFLDQPALRSRLLISPGERVDLVVDFSKLWGQSLVLRNTARAGYPVGPVPNPETVGQIMQFHVTRPLSEKDTSEVPPMLRDGYPDPGPAVRTRQLLLSSTRQMPMSMLLGTVADGRLRAFDPATETPGLNDVEVWEFYNTTIVSHPIHLHLVTFQTLNRQRFTAQQTATGALRNIQFLEPPQEPGPDELGLKDTIVVAPGQVVRVIAQFDREGEYVWHCHMLEHEDHEMMRPLIVGARGNPGAPGAPDPSIAVWLTALTTSVPVQRLTGPGSAEVLGPATEESPAWTDLPGLDAPASQRPGPVSSASASARVALFERENAMARTFGSLLDPVYGTWGDRLPWWLS